LKVRIPRVKNLGSSQIRIKGPAGPFFMKQN
jgi:hypothetical protein